MVDELADLTRVYQQQGKLEIQTRDCRKAKEDAHRVAGKSGDALIYRLPGEIGIVEVFAFFPRDVADLKFSFSSDGRSYVDITALRDSYFHGAGDYDYWKPVRYLAVRSQSWGPSSVTGADYLKIELTGETQIGRVEIGTSQLRVRRVD